MGLSGTHIRTATRLSIIAAALTLALVGSTSGARPAAAAPETTCATDATLDTEERAFLALINNHRLQNGLQPLAASYSLTRASAWKSTDVGVNRYFGHSDFLGRTWDQRIRDCGYLYNTWLGENIAAGVQTAQQAFDIWKNSAGHNANMLGANYTAIGIGRAYAQGSPFGWYWTTAFGGYDDGFVTKSGDAVSTGMRRASPPHSTQRWRHVTPRAASIAVAP
jgi:uncharacterized protein YkwD